MVNYKIRLSKKIKIFRKEDGAFVVNRENGEYQFYNETAADWISLFNCEGIYLEDAIKKAKQEYSEQDWMEVEKDFKDFISQLFSQRYLVSSEMPLYENEPDIFPQAECELFLIEKLPSITIEVTEQCNERCVHCYLPEIRKKKGSSLTVEEIKRCINQLEPLGIEKVTFTGGEAMLYPGLKEVIEYAKGKNLAVSVLSNLTKLTPNIIDILESTDDSNVQVSLYAVTDDIHDRITRLKGSCKQTKDAIIQLRKKNIPVTASMAVMKENYLDVGNVMDFAKANGVTLQFDYVMMAQSDFNKSNLAHRMTVKETEEFFRLMINHDRNFGLNVLRKNNYAKGENLEQSICYVATDGCCVASNGDVYLCPSWQDITLGNIKKQDIADIWNNNVALAKFRNLTLHQIDGCVDCDYRNFCCLCLARNYYENNGNMYVPTKETCAVAKLSKKIYEEFTQTN